MRGGGGGTLKKRVILGGGGGGAPKYKVIFVGGGGGAHEHLLKYCGVVQGHRTDTVILRMLWVYLLFSNELFLFYLCMRWP